MLTFDFFTARSNLLPHAFVWAFYIYMGKMLIIHILDISSKDYDITELKLYDEIRAPSRHKISGWLGGAKVLCIFCHPGRPADIGL